MRSLRPSRSCLCCGQAASHCCDARATHRANTENPATLTSSQQRAVIGVSSPFTRVTIPVPAAREAEGSALSLAWGVLPPGLGPEPDCFMGDGGGGQKAPL